MTRVLPALALTCALAACTHAPPVPVTAARSPAPTPAPTHQTLHTAWQRVCLPAKNPRGPRACRVHDVAVRPDGTVLLVGSHFDAARFGGREVPKRGYDAGFLAEVAPNGRVRRFETIGRSHQGGVERVLPLHGDTVLIAGVHGPGLDPRLPKRKLPVVVIKGVKQDMDYLADEGYLAAVAEDGSLRWVHNGVWLVTGKDVLGFHQEVKRGFVGSDGKPLHSWIPDEVAWIRDLRSDGHGGAWAVFWMNEGEGVVHVDGDGRVLSRRIVKRTSLLGVAVGPKGSLWQVAKSRRGKGEVLERNGPDGRTTAFPLGKRLSFVSGQGELVVDAQGRPALVGSRAGSRPLNRQQLLILDFDRDGHRRFLLPLGGTGAGRSYGLWAMPHALVFETEAHGRRTLLFVDPKSGHLRRSAVLPAATGCRPGVATDASGALATHGKDVFLGVRFTKPPAARGCPPIHAQEIAGLMRLTPVPASGSSAHP